MLAQVLATIALIAGGTFLSYWMRRVDMAGFELWLPFGLLIAVAVSPIAGFLFAVSILVASWFLFPFQLQGVAVIVGCLAVTFFISTLFTFTAATFVVNAMMLIVLYNIVSNILAFFVGISPLRIVKFILLSTWLSWLVYSRYGWELVEFFAA